MSFWTDVRDSTRGFVNKLSLNTIEQGVEEKNDERREARREERAKELRAIRNDPNWKPEHTAEDQKEWAERAAAGSVLHTINGPVTQSYGDWELNGGQTGWEGFMQEVHGISREEALSLPRNAIDALYRGEALGSKVISNPESYFESPKLGKDLEKNAAEMARDDRNISKFFDREVLNPLLQESGGNSLVKSAKENALVRGANTVQDTFRTIDRRGTQLTPAQRMAISNQLSVSNANNATNTVNKAVISQQDTNNKELSSLFELTSRERFANSKTVNQLAGVSAERASDNAAANNAYKNQRFNNTVNGALSGYSMSNGG